MQARRANIASRKYVLPLGLILGTVCVPSMVRAAEPPPTPIINIDIDAADLPPKREALPGIVEAELTRRLAEQADLPPGVFMADDRRVIVELRPSPVPDTIDVLVHVIVELDGQKLAESSTDPCLTCSDAYVGEKAMLMLLPLLSELPAPELAAPEPAPEPTIVESSEPAPAPARSHAGQSKVIGGGVLLGAGLVAVGIGVGLYVVDERLVSDPKALELEFVKYREVGIATLAIGSAAAVTGAVLLGLGLRERSHSHVAIVPMIGPRTAGLSLGGRF